MENFKNLFKKVATGAAILAATSGAAQTKEKPIKLTDLDDGIKTEQNDNSNQTVNTEPFYNPNEGMENLSSLERAFPHDEIVQGITRAEFDKIAKAKIAERFGIDTDKLSETAENRLMVLIYEKLGILQQVNNDEYDISLGKNENVFKRNGDINFDFWNTQLDQMMLELENKITKATAKVHVYKDGTKNVEYPAVGEMASASSHNLKNALRLIEILYRH